MRGALERKEFLLHYQPKVDLATGEISGFEALLRWQRPGHGLVGPLEFVPVLEETGLVVRPLRVFEIFERIMHDSKGAAEYHYVLIDYLCRVTGGTLQRYLLDGEGVETGVDLDALIHVSQWLETLFGRTLEGQVYRAGASTVSA